MHWGTQHNSQTNLPTAIQRAGRRQCAWGGGRAATCCRRMNLLLAGRLVPIAVGKNNEMLVRTAA